MLEATRGLAVTTLQTRAFPSKTPRYVFMSFTDRPEALRVHTARCHLPRACQRCTWNLHTTIKAEHNAPLPPQIAI